MELQVVYALGALDALEEFLVETVLHDAVVYGNRARLKNRASGVVDGDVVFALWQKRSSEGCLTTGVERGASEKGRAYSERHGALRSVSHGLDRMDVNPDRHLLAHH